jgi:hypothetical protein
MLPAIFQTPGVSCDAAGMVQAKSPMTNTPIITNQEDITRFILMTSFRRSVYEIPQTPHPGKAHRSIFPGNASGQTHSQQELQFYLG